jgi:hypothetical protein
VFHSSSWDDTEDGSVYVYGDGDVTSSVNVGFNPPTMKVRRRGRCSSASRHQTLDGKAEHARRGLL